MGEQHLDFDSPLDDDNLDVVSGGTGAQEQLQKKTTGGQSQEQKMKRSQEQTTKRSAEQRRKGG